MTHTDAELDALAGQFITAARRARFAAVAAVRLAAVRLVCERFVDPHNVSACLRSAEAFGVHTVHVLMAARFKAHRQITIGAEQWLDVRHHHDTGSIVAELRAGGFLQVAAVVDPDAEDFAALPAAPRLALWLGSEPDGLSPEALAACDHRVTIPMAGFSESLNVSTATAVLLQHVCRRARATLGEAALLPADARAALVRDWCRREVRDKLRARE